MFCSLLYTLSFQELDLTVSTLLSKSGESNAFIKEDAESSLVAVVKHVSSVKAMGAFINGGAGYVLFVKAFMHTGRPKKT